MKLLKPVVMASTVAALLLVSPGMAQAITATKGPYTTKAQCESARTTYSKLPKTTVGNCFDDGITRVYWYFNYTTS
jgi:hypothetical protein